MKRIYLIIFTGLIVGYYANLWACPEDGKAKAQYINEDEEVSKPYKAVFVEGADLSKYKVVELSVKGVMCEKCIKKIETNLRDVKGVVAMEYIWENKTLRIWGDNIVLDKVINAIKKAGYKAKPKSA